VNTRVFLLFVLVCLATAADGTSASPLLDRDVAALGAAIAHFGTRTDTWPARPKGYIAVNPQTAIIGSEARPDGFLEELHEIRGSVPTDAVGDFIRRNRTKNDIPDSITKVTTVRIQTEEQAGGAPIGLNNHEIGRFITAFTPGYTSDGTTALVRFSFNWSIHGAYATYILKLKHGVWSAVASELTIYL
jgi:hypothetical protein